MKKKILIFTPCYDAMLTMQYTTSLLKLITMMQHKNIEYLVSFLGNESLIPRARNKAVRQFMQTDCTHLFFIDADIQFEPEAFLDLLFADKDVSCCSYAKKGINWNRLKYSLEMEKDSKEDIKSRGLDFNFNCELKNGELQKKGDFFKVRHGATGFMLIKRSIITKLSKCHPELEIKGDQTCEDESSSIGLFCCMIHEKEYLSEDYAFCHRVNEAGGEVWMNCKHNLTHVGRFNFESDLKNRENPVRTHGEKIFYT